ncbi:hypothetical protein [Litoreibacter roseus]|uniref:50S ribosome-binding GTPase n=1 Tax=Litoreibacter roseus TaxID=2601869 RepID=A0A6N6JGW0_9RHOB|nr:hypothetical protein [Litoreibacter roseus]GFE64452.1 hypothetical protein KIN_15260 [Litoreibacter roseus]
MTEPLSPEAATKRLERALASANLPSKAIENGARLLTRLSQPVRVTVFGTAGAGKSSLVNLLVGQQIIPAGLRLPTLELRYGAEAKTICTLGDGSTATLDGIALQEAANMAPVLVAVEADLPALRKISLLEVAAGGDERDHMKAVAWACRRTDIAIWCTQAFAPNERKIWHSVPDALRDHGFLVVTKADIASEKGVLKSHLQALEGVAADWFLKILPLATLEALAANAPDGQLNRDMFKASGAPALISGVKKQVDAGQRASLDQVELFLARHVPDDFEDEPEVDAPNAASVAPEPVVAKLADPIFATDEPVDFAEPEIEPEEGLTFEEVDAELADIPPAEEPSPEIEEVPEDSAPLDLLPPVDVVDEMTADEPVESETDEEAVELPVEEVASERVEELEEETTVDFVGAPPVDAESPEDVAAEAPEPQSVEDDSGLETFGVESAREILASAATAIQGDSDRSADPDSELIIERCQAALETLSANLEQSEDPSATALQEDVTDALDILVLLQMEDAGVAALDAVTLLLQLRRDLDLLNAA